MCSDLCYEQQGLVFCETTVLSQKVMKVYIWGWCGSVPSMAAAGRNILMLVISPRETLLSRTVEPGSSGSTRSRPGQSQMVRGWLPAHQQKGFAFVCHAKGVAACNI